MDDASSARRQYSPGQAANAPLAARLSWPAGKSLVRRAGMVVRWIGPYFVFNFVVIAGLLASVLATVAVAYQEYVQRPRVQMVSEAYAANLAALAVAVRALPPEAQDAHLNNLRKLSGGLVAADEPLGWGLVEPRPSMVRDFIAAVRERLPAYTIGFTSGERPLLWIALPLDHGRTRWIRIDLPVFVMMPTATVALLVALFITVASAGSAYLLVTVRRRLAWVAQALDRVDARTGQPPAAALAQAQDDPAELAAHFKQMTDRLAIAQAERAVLMAGISRDLRGLVQCLRRSQPGAMTPEASRCVAEMERVIGQFSDFAESASSESIQALDVNPLIGELVAQMRTRMPDVPVRAELGGLPYTGLRPTAARRMLGNLLDNAVRHGGQGVEVTTTLEAGWVVVRVLDRGPGLEAHELALVGRPFYRTEAARARGAGSGLGVAIARQEAEAHGGSLRLALRPGGGLQAELWLRPARFE